MDTKGGMQAAMAIGGGIILGAVIDNMAIGLIIGFVAAAVLMKRPFG